LLLRRRGAPEPVRVVLLAQNIKPALELREIQRQSNRNSEYREVVGGQGTHAVKEVPQPQDFLAFGL